MTAFRRWLSPAAIVLTLSLFSFLAEGTSSWDKFRHPIDAWGGGGHFENYISHLKHQQDPTLYPNDPLVQANQRLPIPLIRWGFPPLLKMGLSLDTLLMAGAIIGRVLLFAGLYALSMALYANPLIAWLAGCLALISKVCIGHFPLYGANDFNADIALGLNLLSLSFFFRGRMSPAAFLTGLSFNFHPIIPFWLSALYALYAVKERRQASALLLWAGLLLGASIPFIAIMLPQMKPAAGGTLDTALWLRLFMTTTGTHIIPSMQTAPNPQFWGIFGLWMMLAVFSFLKEPIHPLQQSKLRFLALGIFGCCILAVVFTDLFPSIGMIKAMPARSTIYALAISLPLISAFLVHSYSRIAALPLSAQIPWGALWTVLALSALLAPFHRVPVGIAYGFAVALFTGLRASQPTRPLRFLAWVFLLGLSLAPLALAARTAARTRPNPQEADWKAVQVWAQQHSQKADVFITPPTLCGFRIYSQRTNFISLNDLASIIAVDPRAAQDSAHRMKQLHFEPAATKQAIKAGYRTQLARAMQGYLELRETDLRAIRAEYPTVRYVVTTPSAALHLHPLYSNPSFVIYAI